MSYDITNNWGVGTEVTYKMIGMKADARVNNQAFNMNDATMYFTGTAKMNMLHMRGTIYLSYNIWDLGLFRK